MDARVSFGSIAGDVPSQDLDHHTSGESPTDTDAFTDDDLDIIAHQESIYYLMIVKPAIARRDSGHYWTKGMFIAMALFFLNCMFQGSLILICGMDILQKHDDFQRELVNTSDIRYIAKRNFRLRHPVADEKPQCCRGAQCSVADVVCCPSTLSGQSLSGFAIIDASNMSNVDDVGDDGDAEGENGNINLVSWARKPGGGKGHKGESHDTSEEGDGSEKTQPRTVALCKIRENGNGTAPTMDCGPPALRFVFHWDELDANHDGTWSLEEATTDAANLACRLGVTVEDVFQHACRGLLQDAQEASKAFDDARPYSVPASIVHRTGIPKDWFHWWQGLAALCVHTDTVVCSELVQHGFFNAAMNPLTKGRRGGVTGLDSAMVYCSRLLMTGGICDAALPSTYVLYRSRVRDTCGKHSFKQGSRYHNPYDKNDMMSTVHVKYSTQGEYRTTHTWLFEIFLCLILFIWFAHIADEFKAVLKLGDFVRNFPVDEHVALFDPDSSMSRAIRRSLATVSLGRRNTGESSALIEEDKLTRRTKEEDGTFKYKVLMIGKAHRNICVLVMCVRAALFIFMAWAGTIFLLSNRTYIDLLLNAVALAFIFELDNFFYTFLVSDGVKAQVDNVQEMTFKSSFPQHGVFRHMHEKSIWGFVFIPVCCIIVVVWHDKRIISPVLDALDCLCLQAGQQCEDRTVFDKGWWDEYWVRTAGLPR